MSNKSKKWTSVKDVWVIQKVLTHFTSLFSRGEKVYSKRLYIFYTQSTLIENNVTKNSSKINDIEPYDDSFSLKLANSHLFEST